MAAGFMGFEITWKADVFSGAPQASSAAEFGTVGINFRARKATTDAEWQEALANLNCEMPETPTSIFGADAFYDCGNRGCGDGPLDGIVKIIRRLAPGQTLEVRAIEPSVAEDLPAWCRLSGHQLTEQKDDRYLIRRKG